MKSQLGPTAEHFTALRSAVDLLTDCVSPEYVEEVLADYRYGGARHKFAVSLYALIDHFERSTFSSWTHRGLSDNPTSQEDYEG
jgi:hypothetical protein